MGRSLAVVMHDVAVATLLARFTFRLSDRVRARHHMGWTDCIGSSVTGLPSLEHGQISGFPRRSWLLCWRHSGQAVGFEARVLEKLGPQVHAKPGNECT